MKKLLLLLILYSAAAPAQQVAKSILSANAVNGIIGFLEFKPRDYGTQKHPLIIFLHGSGERGDGTTQINNVAANGIPNLCAHGATMRFTAGGQTSSFVVLSPQLNSSYGSWPAFYAEEMIRYAKANLQIDTNRIYVTGLSLGGGGSWVYAYTSYADAAQVAAVAPVCGTDDGWDANACASTGAANLPIWAFHCEDDGMVGYNNTVHQQFVLGACSSLKVAPRFTFYKTGGHSGAWLNAYDTGHLTRAVDSSLVKTGASTSVNYTANPNLYEWFLMNSRAGSTPVAPPAPAAAAITKAVAVVTASGSTVTLDGSASTGNCGIGSSGWYITDSKGTYVKPASVLSGGMDLGRGNPGVTVITLPAGSYSVRLTIWDLCSGSDKVFAPVTVGAVPAGPMVVQVFTVGSTTYTLYSDGTWK